MRTTTLGAGGPPATVLGLGLAALGRPAYITLGHGADLGPDRSVAALRAQCHAVLDAAYASGVRYVDAARSYGLAEEFLASWPPPGDVTVGSKWGYAYTGDWRLDADVHEVKDLSAGQLRRQLAETRELLGDRLALYQIHSATLESGVLEDAEVLGELAGLRAAGVAVGLTVTGPRQGATVDRALATAAFDTVQATWNLLEPSAGPALGRAAAAGMGVIVKESVANGRLAGEHAPPELVAAAREHATTPDALAIAVALAQPWASVVLSGAATVATLEANVAAADLEVAPDLLAGLAQAPERYWADRGALAWT